MAKIHSQRLLDLGLDVPLVIGKSPQAPSFAQSIGAKLENHLKVGNVADISGFVIASGTDVHYQQLSQLISLGRPIFCEKPICTDKTQAKEILEMQKSYETHVMVGYHRRFDPKFMALKEELAGKEILCINIINYDPLPPAALAAKHEASTQFDTSIGSIFVDFTIHDFDMLRYLTGEEYSISNVFNQQIPETGEEESMVILQSNLSSHRAVIQNSRNCGYAQDQRVSVVTSKKEYHLENAFPLPEDFISRYQKAYDDQMRSFLELLQGEKIDNNTRPTLKDGVASLNLALQCDELTAKKQ